MDVHISLRLFSTCLIQKKLVIKLSYIISYKICLISCVPKTPGSSLILKRKKVKTSFIRRCLTVVFKELDHFWWTTNRLKKQLFWNKTSTIGPIILHISDAHEPGHGLLCSPSLLRSVAKQTMFLFVSNTNVPSQKHWGHKPKRANHMFCQLTRAAEWKGAQSHHSPAPGGSREHAGHTKQGKRWGVHWGKGIWFSSYLF